MAVGQGVTVAGTYCLVLTARGGALRHSEEVEVRWDRELRIELETGRVAGRVLDVYGAAVDAVRVTLRPSAGAVPGAPGVAPSYSVASDSQGRFELASVDAGSWRLAASREGYATASESIELGAGEVREGLVLELEETAGVSFTVATAAGAPAEVRFAVLDAMGESVAGGSSATFGEGRVRLSTIPAGQWQLLVRASVPGAGTLSRPILAPGELGTLGLPAAGTLRVRVAALEEAPVPAAVTLFASDGRLYRAVGAGDTVRRRWPLVGGRATIPNVTAGLLTVRVEAADGGSWTGSVRVPAGGVVELSL